MQFLEKYNKLKAIDENVGKILMLKSGVFYVCIGIDAYILSDVLELKLVKFSNTYKVGIPISSLQKYMRKMKEYDIPFCVYLDDDLVYSASGDFCNVLKTEKFECLLELFKLKPVILKYMKKYYLGNLGEVL